MWLKKLSKMVREPAASLSWVRGFGACGDVVMMIVSELMYYQVCGHQDLDMKMAARGVARGPLFGFLLSSL
jgi:hypothetical protein